MQSEIKTEYPQILTRTSPLLLCISGGKRVPQDQEKEEELQKLTALQQNEKELEGKEFKGDGSDPIS